MVKVGEAGKVMGLIIFLQYSQGVTDDNMLAARHASALYTLSELIKQQSSGCQPTCIRATSERRTMLARCLD